MANIGHYEKVRALSAAGRVVVIGGVRAGKTSQVTVYDRVSHKVVGQHTLPAHVLGLASTEAHTAAACSDGVLRILKTATGAVDREIKAFDGEARAVAVLPSLDRVVVGGEGGVLKIFALATGAEIASHKVSSSALRAVAADPTGEYVAGGGDDGMVHVVTLAGGAVRSMAGTEGAVFSLAFTPRDGRIIAGGEDGLLRFYYLVGDTDFEVRGEGDAGHTGPVTAIVFSSTPPRQKDGTDAGDRYFTASTDGTIKGHRLGDRRKPKTHSPGGALHGLCFASAPQEQGGETTRLGFLFGAGDLRAIYEMQIDGTGALPDAATSHGDGFSALASAMNGQKPAREGALKTLIDLDETEAVDMVINAAQRDRFVEVRVAAIKALGAHGRRAARAALRQLLSDGEQGVRNAAYDALATIDRDVPLATPRAALESKRPDMRSRGLGDLAALNETSPLAAGLIANLVVDEDRNVRRDALDWYVSIHAPTDPDPLRLGFERGPADIRVLALIKAALAGLLPSTALEAVVARAFDDGDAEVRRMVFALRVLERPRLSAVLEGKDQDLHRAIVDVCRHAAKALGIAKKEASDDDAKKAREKLSEALAKGLAAHGGAEAGGEGLTEGDVSPLLTAMACRTADTALRGAKGLADLGDTRALGALLQLSREGDQQIRRQAALSLQTLSDPRAKKRLVWMLDDGVADVRAAAYDALSRLEGSENALAEAALRSSQQDIRVRGLNLLVKKGEQRGEETEHLLEDALEDEAEKVRAEAFRTLWSWHSKEPERALTRTLDARFPDLRLRAVAELKANGKQPWVLEKLHTTIGDRDEAVALAAYQAEVELKGKTDPEPHIAAMSSAHPAVRAAGADGAAKTDKAELEKVRSPLMKLLGDDAPKVRLSALKTLDKIFAKEPGPLYVGLQSSFYDLKVEAAEYLADRRDEQIIDAMRGLLCDKELARTIQPQVLTALRFRAAKALATLASLRLLRFYADLLKDEQGDVREQGARGLSNASRKGDEGFLLDALGHADIAVRSWAAEGLSRLGDPRALPVLTGSLRHEHPPIRVGAILSFAALGPEGYGGMLQGLEDPAREVQELVFTVILARDLRAFRRGEAPDLLTSALSSQRPDVRFAAARALELRGSPEAYLAHLVEMLSPHKPEKASESKDWPSDEKRSRLLVALSEALASERPEVRYAAAQALRLRRKPAEFFREVESLTKLRAATAPVVPETTPRQAAEGDTAPKAGFLRRLFAEGVEGNRGADDAPTEEQRRLRLLAFGAYVGLLRQPASGEDEAHRVKRDAIERIVDLCGAGQVSQVSAVPALVRALDDPNYLVRRAALAGLKKVFPEGADEPLTLALSATSDDVARAALDELAARGEGARPRIAAALDAPLAEVRKYAFELLEKLSPKGSLDPLIAALESSYADIRVGVIERLSSSQDQRVVAALVRAMQSDHEDLRLRSAELLSRRKDDRAADVLGSFLRADDAQVAQRAQSALSQLASDAAVKALAQRLEDAQPAERATLCGRLGSTKNRSAVAVLVQRFVDEDENVRSEAFSGAMLIAGDERKDRKLDVMMAFMPAAVAAKDPALRKRAAVELDFGDEQGQSDLLVSLFRDRDREARLAAVTSYATRVREKGAQLAPLLGVLAGGARDLMLPAAVGVAHRGDSAALRPLLLISRAGEAGEREQALVALGTLGDLRAFDELELIASGGAKDAPVEPSMREAAVEALGRIFHKLTDEQVRQRVQERIDQALAGTDDLTIGGIRATRWMGGERARTKLEAFVTDNDVDGAIKIVAIEMLEALGDPACEQALALALRHYEDEVRIAGRKALETLFPRERTRVEFHAIESEHEDVSEPAATYLAEEGDSALLLPRLGTLKSAQLQSRLMFGLLRRATLPTAPLVALLKGDATDGRGNAAWLIGSRAELWASEEKAPLAAALAEGFDKTASRWAAAADDDKGAELHAWEQLLWAASKLGGKPVLDKARALLARADAPASLRRLAVLALSAGNDAADVAVLTKALSDADAGVRAEAAAAIGRLSPNDATKKALAVTPFDPVSFMAAVAKPDISTLATDAGRRLTVPALISRGEVAPLLPLLRDKDETTRLDAIGAVGFIGGPDAIAALKDIAFDKKAFDANTRKAAYRALRRAQRKAARSEEARA